MTDSEININPDVRQIILSRGKIATVDAADYEWLNQWKWHCTKRGYAVRTIRIGKGTRKKPLRKAVFMHRMIMKTPIGMDTDHINGDKLDNRRCNLRIGTHAQNMSNMKAHIGSSNYKGVHWDCRKNRWIAQLGFNYKKIFIGAFISESKAALAYNKKAIELFGKFARLNIID